MMSSLGCGVFAVETVEHSVQSVAVRTKAACQLSEAFPERCQQKPEELYSESEDALHRQKLFVWSSNSRNGSYKRQ
jgi:hypothetical protein